MAVTINTSPQLYTPSDNPITWRFSSTKTAELNFSYIVELYVNGALDSRHLIFPEVGIYAHFDASERMKAVTPSISVTNAVVSNANNTATCYVKVYEKYGATPILQASATSSTIYSFKASLSNDDFINWDYTDYIVGVGVGVNECLTDFDSTALKLYSDKDFFLQIINNQLLSNLVVEYYDSSDALLSDQTFAIANTIPIAQFNLKTSLITVPSNTSYLLVSAQYSTYYSNPKKIYIETENACDTYNNVIWLNKFGAFDQYVFTHNFTRKATISKQEYERQFGAWNGNNFEYSSLNSGTTAYLKTIEDSGEIVSGWINEALQNSLVQLYESPFVFVQYAVTTYFQITVENSAYDIKQAKYEDLFNEIVQYKRCNQRKSILL